jgi:hypothetical protein
MTDSILREPPAAGTEVDTLVGALERQRRIVAWKCGDLDAAGLRAKLGPSAMTLGGLLKHLALVEDEMFQRWLAGRPLPAPWNAVDFDADPEWEWRTGAQDTPEEVRTLWADAVARSRAALAEALAAGDLDQRGHIVRRGESPSVRYILMAMIEEYARHAGHADLLRESVDGLVGEDPPE